MGPGGILRTLDSTSASCDVRVALLGPLQRLPTAGRNLPRVTGGRRDPHLLGPQPVGLVQRGTEGGRVPSSRSPLLALVVQHPKPLVTIPAGINRCRRIRLLRRPHCVVVSRDRETPTDLSLMESNTLPCHIALLCQPLQRPLVLTQCSYKPSCDHLGAWSLSLGDNTNATLLYYPRPVLRRIPFLSQSELVCVRHSRLTPLLCFLWHHKDH